ncbi:K02A2.6-like [Cordylochernes scorpioides]|uniref:RNA-directed DNA polymerase n=1 Tax=Cordylochernes scorpioides TaxID=51811 RepID=A0ABY6KIP5_9ARAC|nr:K02A2.6-like [Cordylochernes scorpioides]
MQNINPPEQFNFNNPNEWPNWIKRFERFRKASELKSKKEEEQVNALIYILGEKAEDALISFNLTEIEINNYETVVKKFEEHFIGKRNVIFERAQFNRRYQQDGEAVEEYIRVLHKMAENCNYGSLKEEMIRDRIVVGVKNLQLSEKLQLEPNLTLERAIQAACQTECVKQQQTILRSTTTQAANVDQVYEKKLPPRRFNSTNGKGDASKKSKFQKWSKPEKSGCIRCGASKFHPYKDCPAKEVKCHKCKKVGHFAKVCYNKTVGQVTQGDDYHFVGNIYENGQNSNDWKVYVKVDKIKILFKMDTGADVNIIPQEIYFKNFAHKKLCKPDIQLLGPRQVKLHVIGKFTALIEKDGRSIPGEIFVVPQLMQPLLSGKACESLNLIKILQSIEKRNSLNPFEEYPKLFTGLGTLQGSYTIKLKDESQPHAIYTPRRIPIPLLNKTKEQLDQMVEKGVIEKVEQPTDWCAPMVIVPKPSSNDLRICVDLTALNKFVKREHYPIPSVEYTLAQMGGAKLFSKLDANSGFWQIPLSEESSSLTTFLTPFGRYRFKRLPFGISSAPEVFQRKMSNLLESQSGVNCHMDDIVIWGATQEEHDERLRCVLRKLQDSGLTLNKEKCIFSVKEIKFLGHLITERGVLPDPNKVQAIREFPSPSSISEVRRFLGMVNFTGKFIPDLSTILYPLNQLLVKRNDWRWDSAQEEAFEKVKKLLSTSPALTLFDPNLPTTVSADASSYGLGAVLLQKSEDGYQKAVAYASRTMSETEKRWAQIEKESLAIVWACERFQDYLMGNTFSIETDHKPLIPIFSTKNLDEMTPRIQRLRLRMMRYSYSIHHTPGKDIVVADALSRSPIKISHEKDLENEICSFVQQITSCPPFKDENMKEIWQYQNEERECREIKDYCEKGWPTKNELSAEAKAFWCLRYEMSVIDGLLMRNSRIYIPKSLRSKVLNSLHEGHLGIEKCRGRARSSVWWPRISQEIGELVRNCPNCIEERSNPQQPLIVSDFPSRPWEKVGIDHFYLKGKYYLLIADYYSRFPELALLEDQTTHSTILHCKSIFARHGIPEEVKSDNGPQFGLEFKKFAKEYGFHHITSSPRFPQSNGFIESMVKNIKNQLKKGRDPYLSLLGYRTAPLENGYSPAELCMNRKLRTTVPTSPVQLQSRIPDLENLEMREKDQRHKKKTHFDIHHRARELPHLDKGTRVWVKDLRVPGVVLEDAGSPRSYIVNSPKGILRRNRFHLLPNPQGEKIDMEDEEMESPEMSQCFTSTGDNTTCDSEPRTFQRSPEPVKTRSGRVIQPPETFDFSTPNEWPKWRKRFERYLVVSGMKKKEEADKIDLFMYLMGDRADDIFRTFKFEKEEEATKFDSVLKAFGSHFCVRKNIIYERAKFNSRIQEDREPVDEFITSLYKLADSCEFEGLHEQLIRDRIVVGVRDKALSERMQLDSELTLEKAVKLVRQQEAVRQQQDDLQRPSTSQKVNQVKFNSKKQSPKQQQQPSRKKEKSAKTRSRCPKCGGFTHREGQACRAEGQRSNLCSKTGHFANCCPDKQAKTAEVKAVSELDEEIGFLLEVSAVEDSPNLDNDEDECRRRWTAEIQVNGKQVKFKLDSQADVTCVPLCLFKKIMGQQRLVESDINIRAAEFSELQTVGMFVSTLRNGNYEIKEKIYVIRRLSEPLLSRRACELLNLARRIEVVAMRINPIKEFPEVFEGLGQIGNPYEIKLKPGAKPYAVHTPRRVPIPLMEKLKTRLDIPGKELLDADALSRQPLLTTEGGENERQTSAHINSVLSSITDKDKMLTKIFEAQQEDTTLKAVVNYLEKGWPDKRKMSQALLSYWHVKDELGVQNGLLMRSCRLVIPASMKLEILDKLHAGHFGITKTILRARETIAETVRKCSVCIQEAVSKHEPLIPTNFPTRPWQKIGMDLFKFENKWYLVVIDYYSHFPEIIQLDRLTANVVVRSCKSIFARHGIPETVVSDNGMQFGAAREFANFARQYGFTHVTSSPRFPQSNGMAEAGVKIAKLILKKNQDPSLGLLEYRSTPLENGYSPAELLMGRKLRTTLPIAPENLNPRLVDSQTLKRKEGRRRKDMKSRYDRRCGATDMEELSEGDTVWITDMRTWGIVKQKASAPRSYMVDTPVGTLRRNRFHLRKGDTVQYPADPSTPTFSGEELVENEKTPVVDYPSNDSEDGQIRTRSG